MRLIALSFLAFALLASGCSEFLNPSPSTLPTTQSAAQQQLAKIQNDVNITVAGLNLAHVAGAFSAPAQWALVQTYEADAQMAVNLAQAGIDAANAGGSVDLATLLNNAANAVTTFKGQASNGAGK